MKPSLNILIFAIFVFVAAGQLNANAQGGGFGSGVMQVVGAVTAVDTTANTLTVQGRGQDTAPITVKINDATKYTRLAIVPYISLKVGDIIQAAGQTPYQAGDSSIAASRITVLNSLLPARPAGADAGRRGGGGPRTGIAGTIVTLTPALTIKTADGNTVTVTTTDTTSVSATQPATLADVATGTNVFITTGTDSNATLLAKIVAVTPAFERKGGTN